MHIIQQFLMVLTNLVSVVSEKKRRLHEDTPSHALNLIIAIILTGNLVTASAYQNTYAAGNILYATPNGLSSGLCNSWATACTLQTALTTSTSGNEIWVSSGTHMPTTSSTQTVSFVMKDGIAIYGGFSGSETLRDQRDPVIHITVLSGDIGTVGDVLDNSFNVVTSDSVSISSIIDGLTISGGYANHSSTNPYKGGGGINIINSSLTISNVIFSNNYGTFGGGIYTNNSNLTLDNVVFNVNTASEAGAIYNENNSNIILNGVVFNKNFSYADKGAMANIGSNSDLTNVTFTNNGSSGWSGGIFNSNSDSTLENTVFKNNSGGVGGAISNINNSTLYIDNSLFELNKSTDGGAIYNDSYLNIKNSTFLKNDASHSYDLSGSGGVLYNTFGEVILTNITAVGNSAQAIPAIVNRGNLGILTIHNSIIWGNTGSGPQIQDSLSSTSFVDHSIIQGGYDGTGNSYLNPLVDTLENNGGNTQTIGLLFGSPAIDAGDDASCPLIDQRGIARPQGPNCDMGAYEYQDVAPSVLAINRISTSPTSATSVDFTVTFSEPVTYVDEDGSDFQLFTSDISDASIVGVVGTNRTYTVTVNTGSGNGSIRLDIPDTASILDLANNPLIGLPYNSGEVYDIVKIIPSTATFISTATQDGQILETTETSGKGGTIDSSAIRINLGDDAANKQYRAILSFDTSSLPDNAVITSVTLKVKYAGKVGTLPFSTHGNLMADIRKGSFSNNATLQANDFKAGASKNNVLSFSNSMVSNWFSQSLAPANFQYVNLTNVTQFRLRFQTDDNHDFGADLLKIFSSNAGASGKPKLIVEYYVP